MYYGFAGSSLLLGNFPSCGEWGLLHRHGLLTAVASLIAERRLSAHGLRQLELLCSRTRAQQCGARA